MRQFSLLIKPASADCNLRCPYCFYLGHSSMYPDRKVHRMSEEVLDRLVSGYMSVDQDVYAFAWQGGEPALMGVDFYRKVVELQQKYGRPGSVVSNSFQTNATLIDDEFAAHLAEYRFLVGVSIDGPEDIHDHYRKTIDGRGSHAAVLKAMDCLTRQGAEFNTLALVTPANVGRAKEVYRYLCDLGVQYHQYIPCIEFDDKGQLLPFAVTGQQYGDFLCELFDEWIKEDSRRISVRLFDSIVTLMVNGTATSCHLGTNCKQYFVVEYNGDVYPCDFFVESDLKLGNMMETSWLEFDQSADYAAFGRQKSQWCDECKTCEIKWVCRGDCLKYRAIDAPGGKLSWLCEGWKKFYAHAVPGFERLAEEIKREVEMQQAFAQQSPVASGQEASRSISQVPQGEIGRNDPCPCGSGKKFKKCHGA